MTPSVSASHLPSNRRGPTGTTPGSPSDLLRPEAGPVVGARSHGLAHAATDLAEALCLAARAELAP